MRKLKEEISPIVKQSLFVIFVVAPVASILFGAIAYMLI